MHKLIKALRQEVKIAHEERQAQAELIKQLQIDLKQVKKPKRSNKQILKQSATSDYLSEDTEVANMPLRVVVTHKYMQHKTPTVNDLHIYK